MDVRLSIESTGSMASTGFTNRMAPSLSIVIPTWNGLDLLRECLPSVQAAAARYRAVAGAPTELIVVDDGSSDETVSRLVAHARRLVSEQGAETHVEAATEGAEVTLRG